MPCHKSQHEAVLTAPISPQAILAALAGTGKILVHINMPKGNTISMLVEPAQQLSDHQEFLGKLHSPFSGAACEVCGEITSDGQVQQLSPMNAEGMYFFCSLFGKRSTAFAEDCEGDK